jgi:ATP-dependent DNA helicase RecQ
MDGTRLCNDELYTTLQRVFGFSSFRPGQEEIVRTLLAGKNALVIMPTGGGKSLCYQLPALVRPGTGIVVSPLIALMRDQVVALREVGVRAECLNSSLTEEESSDVVRRLLRGEVEILYLAPERIVLEGTQELLKKCALSLIAIDEAHCISQWGHDFRPDYVELSVLRKLFPQVPMVALTATADEPTRLDIAARLLLDPYVPFSFGFDRPNIEYRIALKDEPRQQLLSFITREYPQESGIIYCMSRKKVEELAEWLKRRGMSRVVPYHAGLPAEVRKANQDFFIHEEGVTVVATVAFGMGIDKSNVRYVVHMDLPKSIEAYYQETGRAGRDGLPSTALLLYSLSDMVALKQMMASSGLDEEHRQLEQRKLSALLGVCETSACRRQVLLRYFGEDLSTPCGNCDTCKSPPSVWDGTIAAKKAVSAVYRTGQRFGAAYITAVLRGEADERMVRFQHDKLGVFGVGADIDARTWMSIIRQLVSMGYLTVDLAGYGGISLSPMAQKLLKDDLQIFFRRDVIALKEKISKRTVKNAVPVPLEGVDVGVFEKLRAERLSIARAANVPPYVVFHDSTLREIAQKKPQTLEEFKGIAGVGEKKLAAYGELFLAVLKSA